ncbi:hypothetical protein D9M68_401240 [compost metagenome]
MLAAVPGALVHRFFLTPDHVLEVLVRSQGFGQILFRERIELLDTDDRDVVATFGTALLQQVVVDLAAAQDDAVDLLRIQAVDLADDSLERAVGQFFQGRDGQLVAQQRLRRHHDQRLAQRTDHLAAQHVVDLSRGGRYADLDVLLGAQLQVAFQTRGGVLRTLALVAVRQQHGQAAEALPLDLAAGDELVDHHLRAVGEVAELGFPDHQRVRRGGGVAVFEGQHRLFREVRVVDGHARLAVIEVGQRYVDRTVLLAVQHGVTVGEGAAADVLAGHAHRVAFEQQGRVRQVLGEAPVDRQAAGGHLLAVFEDLRNLALDDEAFRGCQQLAGQFLQGLQVEAGVVTGGPGMAQVRTPIDEQFLVRLLDQTFHHVQAVVQRVAVAVDLGLDLLGAQHAVPDQRVGVQFTGGALFGDLLVHQRLGAARFVGLVVAAATVADQVDDHVTLELHAIVDGQLGDEQHGFRIVAIHMEDRRLDHLRHVGRILGGTSVVLTVGGEADLVVDHDVDGAARLVGTGLRHLEGFHDHALPRERGIAVDGDRHDLVAVAIVAAVLAGAHGTLDHRGNDFQVGRVERQGQVDFAACGHDVGGEALVVLHVTGAELDDLLAFELVEQVARVLAEGVDQHVEAAAVGHADDDFLGAVGAAALDDLVDHRNQALAAFQAETLGARVFGAQVLFQALGRGQALEQVGTRFGGILRTATHALQALGEPVALLGVDDVHELGADAAAIGLLEGVEDFAQGRLFLADVQLTGAEGGVEVGSGQAVMVDRQVGGRGAHPEAQRIERGSLVAAQAVGQDQTQDFYLLLLVLGAYAASGDRLCAALVLGQQDEMITNGGVRNVGSGITVGGEFLEVRAPLFGHSVGIVQVELVELFDVGSVATG